MESTQHRTAATRVAGRIALYLGGLGAAMFVAFIIGVSHFEATECSGPDFGGECDLAPLEGMVWAAATFLIGVVAIIVIEVGRIRATRGR